ncbi:hypothetical protein ACI0FR_00474 [Paenochrobactrum sp. BZR 201-1]
MVDFGTRLYWTNSVKLVQSFYLTSSLASAN